MAEIREVNPASNLQRTVAAQEGRVAVSERPRNFLDRFRGEHVYGGVDASYEKGIGGFVKTEIHSGKAYMMQKWGFDKEGNLSAVTLERFLQTGSEDSDAGRIELTRNANGKFAIKEINVEGQLSSLWAEEFQIAQTRLNAGQKARSKK